MKKLYKFGISVLLLLTISCEKSEEKTTLLNLSCLPTNLQNGVIAFYSFGNGSLDDSSGNNYNLTNTTTASSAMDRAGNPNCAYQFNRVNSDFLKYTNPTFLDNLPTNNLSISFWYKSNDAESGIFISRNDQPYCNFAKGEWSIHHVNNVLLYSLPNGEVSNYGIETTSWEHIVVTSNNIGNQLFVNGVLIINGSGINGDNCPLLNQGDLFIGKLYDGLIDDIIIYNTILTPTEVTQLYNLSACCN